MWAQLNRLFSVPKGFGKFYPKGATKKTNKKGIGSGGGGGGGGGGGPWNPRKNDVPDSVKVVGLVFGTGFAYYLLTGSRSTTLFGKEITFQDFQSLLLETGRVDRIVVTNKNIAKIILKPTARYGGDADSSDANSDGNSDAPLMTALRKVETAFGGSKQSQGRGQGQQQSSEWSESLDAAGTARPYESDSRRDTDRLNVPDRSIGKDAASMYYFSIGSVEAFERKLEEMQRALKIEPRDFIPVMYVQETSAGAELMRFAPTIAIIGAYFLFMQFTKGGGMGGGGGGGPGGIFNIGKSKAKKISPESVSVTFADVAGCDEAKMEIMEFIDFLKEPKRFTDLGAKIPKGALLCGPPGTGKTMLAKATAGEANVPFYSVSGSDFVEMFVGVGPARVRDLFKEARANSPCIVFIDEIDAVGRARGRGAVGGNDERENTLNQLLVEMDGFDETTGIVLLAGTNRVDVLDSALTRAGRFDRQITVDKPDLKGRKAIFEVHLAGINLAGVSADYSSRLAALTPGFVGADIANMCNEAAIVAARRAKEKVDLDDFEKATDRLVGGLESNKIMSPEERRVVAYHEAGHAVAGWNLKYADPLLKVTIVPRGSGALGYAQYLPKEIFLRTREQILDIVCMALAGRAAEQVTFGNVTTGAADDLRRVTQIVYQMVQVYGMNDKIGQISFPREDNGGYPDKLYSNATAEVMDSEVRAIVEEAYQRTLDLMTSKREQVIKVAEMLLEKETITNRDVTDLIGARPHSAGAEYEEYANSGWKKPLADLGLTMDKAPESGADTSADESGLPGTVVPGFSALP